MAITTVQPAALKDIPAIQHIVAVSWPATYGEILSADQLTYMIDLFYRDDALKEQMTAGHQFFILREEGKDTALGFIDIEKCSASVCKLHKIYLLPTLQGKGYGKVLMNFALRQGQKMGGRLLKLNVNRYNKARGFYEHMGFAIDETVDNPIGQGYYMNDYIMVKSLEG